MILPQALGKNIQCNLAPRAASLQIGVEGPCAMEIPDWETVRECDLFIGFISQDPEILSKVYFGTPYLPYRQRILRLAGNRFLKTESYIWNQTPHAPVVEVFDLLAGKLDSAPSGLERGRLMHRLLILLAKDFYRPVSVIRAFSEIFPNEHFTQQGSTNRIIQIVKRLRTWSKNHGDPFFIEENEGDYRLNMKPGMGLRVPREWPTLSQYDLTWNELVRSLSSDVFTKKDVIQKLKCSTATANRLLRWTLASNLCQVVGSGPHRKYRLLKKS